MRGGVFPKGFDDHGNSMNPRRRNFCLKEPDMAWVKVGVVTEMEDTVVGPVAHCKRVTIETVCLRGPLSRLTGTEEGPKRMEILGCGVWGRGGAAKKPGVRLGHGIPGLATPLPRWNHEIKLFREDIPSIQSHTPKDAYN